MFETTLLESNRKKLARKSKWYLSGPLSIAIHSVAIGLLAFMAVWHVEPVDDPPIKVILVTAPAPPPPPPPARKRAPRQEIKPEDMQTVKTPVQPIEIPENLPQANTNNEDEGIEGSFGDEGVEGGVEGGVPGGVLGSVPTSTDEEPVRLTAEMTRPELIHRVEPDYPEVARRARLEGLVVLEAVITRSGAVEDVRVVRSAGAMLDQYAMDAVRQWKYKPAMLNGVPTKVYLTVTISFRIR